MSQFIKDFICYLIVGLLHVALATVTFASPESKSTYIQDTKTNYLPRASNLAKSKEGIVKSQLPTGWGEGEDPLFYEGNDAAGMTAAYMQDAIVNLTEDFWGCLDLEIVGLCYDDGVPDGFKIEYRWPVQTVHTHGFFQNRYFPTQYYTSLGSSDYMAENYYPIVKDFLAAFVIGRGANVSWSQAMLHGQTINQGGSVGSVDVDLEIADKRQRYATGSIGTAGHLEYSIVPTVAQLAWAAITKIYPILEYIPCTPPTQFPIPLTSEDPAWIAFTRNPTLHTLLFKETDLQNDMMLWWDDPTACVRYNMNPKQGNIPYDMYNPATISFETLANPPLFSPMSDGDLKKYGGMCTKNWGASLPITTIESLHHNDIVHAGINFLKALKLGWGIYLTFLRQDDFPKSGNKLKIWDPEAWKNQSGAAKYVAYYPVDKEKDRLQFTYNDKAPKKCMKVGEPAPKFENADQMRMEGAHGLYSITHWKYFKCCMGFF